MIYDEYAVIILQKVKQMEHDYCGIYAHCTECPMFNKRDRTCPKHIEYLHYLEVEGGKTMKLTRIISNELKHFGYKSSVQYIEGIPTFDVFNNDEHYQVVGEYKFEKLFHTLTKGGETQCQRKDVR